MAVITCQNCGEEIDACFGACPECGAITGVGPDPRTGKAMLIVSIVIICLGAAFYWVLTR